MGTEIYRTDYMGGRVEVTQEHIDFWCSQCQFPIGQERCTDKIDIQRCWNEVGENAGAWHLLHECPFTHNNEQCRCNDFKTIEEAFQFLNIPYNKP